MALRMMISSGSTRRLPDSVVVTSTSEFLYGLEDRGLLESAMDILTRAVTIRGNDVLTRYLQGSENSEPMDQWTDRMRPQ